MVDRHIKDTWSVFKIMGEFVEGFEALRDTWPSVSIFGGARMRKASPYYRDASRLSELLASRGYSILTGGGPGIMEAANRSACPSTCPRSRGRTVMSEPRSGSTTSLPAR